MLLKVLTILLILAATAACLLMVVFLMAGGANSTPKQITQIKWISIATGLAWLICIGGSIFALITSRPPLLAPWLAAAPIALVIAAFIIMFITEW